MTGGFPAPEQLPKKPRRQLPASATVTAIAVLVGLAAVVLVLRWGLRRGITHACGPEVPRPDSLYVAGDTMVEHEVLETMLARLSVPWDRIEQARAALAKTDFAFRRLRPGDSVTLKYRGMELVGLTYHKDMVTGYEVSFDTSGALAVKTVADVDTVRSVVVGTLKESIWHSLVGLGEEPWLVMTFTDILRYDVDFFTESNDGDSFQLLVDKLFVDTTFYRYGRVHAVHYKGRTDNTYGFFYQDPTGHWDFFNEKGQSLRKTVLRSPLQFAKITSHFGMRFHPIRKIRCPHNGVDYAAPSGTPVSAVADGTVSICRWLGGYGRLVEIQHKGNLASRYGHLSGFGPGVKQGRGVRQGQTIGYVGSTGMSTGPHLHFEIRKSGTPVNPLKVIPPRADPVPKKYRDEFDRIKGQCLAEIERVTEMARLNRVTVQDSAAGN